MCRRTGGGTRPCDATFLQLADGKRVYHALDLLPVVAERSGTAAAARQSAQLRTLSTLAAAGAGLAFASSIYFGIAHVAREQSIHGPPEADKPLFGFSGITLSIVAGAAASLAYVVLMSQHGKHQSRAFTAYEASLLHRMRLCKEDGELVDCGP
ncbi:MAG: hypothetical protein MJD61_16505 [Proteobacteria bacterium]|nr:hypothetical protein [Pseudomonadota bacterium]